MTILSELPEGAVKVNSIWDLIDINPKHENKYKPKYGGKIYLKSVLSDGYEEYDFEEHITSKKIKKYLRSGQLYFLENL